MSKIPADSFTFEVVEDKGEKKIKINAPVYYRHWIKSHTKSGDKGTMYLTLAKPTRSDAQLRYYYVVIGLIADYCGYNVDELHDAMMRLKFGTTKVKIGKDTVEVRKSISKRAKLTKIETMELIDFVIEKAFELNVEIPSAQSLGYYK